MRFPMVWILIILAALLAALSLRGEGERARYWRERAGARRGGEWPRATVIVPVKGEEEGLRENLASLARLDYPDYELIVVSRRAEDVPRGVTPERARLIHAGEGDGETGGKIVNLLAAVRAARKESEVFAFADSDGRVPVGWLRALAAALDEEHVGAATGYRWHLPHPVDLPSLLRSVWNAVIVDGMGPPGEPRFCWGGAMAVRRDTFERLNIPGWWRGAVSDDYRLSEAVRRAGMRIRFAPGAMVATLDHTEGMEFLGWITRQMRITRFYAPGLWGAALAAHVVYCAAMAGAAWLLWGGSWAAGVALGWQLGTGMWKGWRRVANARAVMGEYDGWFRRWGWAHVALAPVGTWLWLYGCAAAGLSNRIRWRGGAYRLKRLSAVGTKQ